MNRLFVSALIFLLPLLSARASSNLSMSSSALPVVSAVAKGVNLLLARVYDPQTGRFLSADIVVQNPSNLQSYNRYAYSLNNPLRYVDPSGYVVWRPEERAIPEDATDDQRQEIETYNAKVREYLGFLDKIKETEYGAKVYANLDSKKETFAFQAVNNQKGELAGYTVNERVVSENGIQNQFIGAVMYEGKVDHQTFLNQVVQPSLARLDNLSGRSYNSENARDLLLSTAIHESDDFLHRRQYPRGPGRSFYQINQIHLMICTIDT
ncbi:MAG: hypothetical protein JW942_06405 [Opitutales bacterium]|nr:hypothetical protein [Opitutales bacterium]